MDQVTAIRFLSTLAYSSAGISIFTIILSLQFMRTGRLKAEVKDYTDYGRPFLATGITAFLFGSTALVSLGTILNLNSTINSESDFFYPVFLAAVSWVCLLFAVGYYYVLPIMRRRT
jgi:hypothetical protein